jgi:hypothetical protein
MKDIDSWSRFSRRTTLCHVETCMIIGLLASTRLDYARTCGP